MEADDIFGIIVWVMGAMGALLTFLFGLWWKIESRQDKKIDSLQVVNGKDHRDLHDKIDSNHHAIRDRLDNIWKHLSSKDDR